MNPVATAGLARLPTRPELTGLIALACRAPSVHNTQPWLWGVRDGTVELRADRSRRLRHTDPSGRELVVSCGAALHHLRVVAAAHGYAAAVARLPDAARPDVLARVGLTPTEGPAAGTERDLAAIRARVTDRRRFTSWPVPDDRLEQLAAAGREEDVDVVALLDVVRRHRADLLLTRAVAVQGADPRIREEQDRWVGHGPGDGMPVANAPAGGRLAPGPSPELVERSDGVLVLTTAADDTGAWLRTGEALSALWLLATTEQLSIVPLSQVVEVPETRAALQHHVLDGRALPQLAVRVGWQEIARSTLARTPRRAVDDVLLR